MKLTCSQMDVLISFYLEGDLSNSLKKDVEEHIEKCSHCRAKFDIIKSMIEDLGNEIRGNDENILKNNSFSTSDFTTSKHFRVFKNNLSAYIDNELSNDENIKIKKYTINNTNARKELETTYQLRKLMNDSFKKAKNENKQDFAKNTLRQLELEEAVLGIHPAIKLLIIFTILVLTITSFVLISLRV